MGNRVDRRQAGSDGAAWQEARRDSLRRRP